jgi:DNA anti-recombination protein RmuC
VVDIRSPKWIAKSRLFEALLIAAACVTHGNAQSAPQAQTNVASKTESTADTLRTIDQLIEQNKKLEQQNQQLINELQNLRAAIARQGDSTLNHPPTPNDAQPTKTAGVL